MNSRFDDKSLQFSWMLEINVDFFSSTCINFDASLMLLAVTCKFFNIFKVSDHQMIDIMRCTNFSQFIIKYFGLIHNFNNILTSMNSGFDDESLQISWMLKIDVELFSSTPLNSNDSLMLLASTYKNFNIYKVSDYQMIDLMRYPNFSQFMSKYFGLIHNFNNVLTSMNSEFDDESLQFS